MRAQRSFFYRDAAGSSGCRTTRAAGRWLSGASRCSSSPALVGVWPTIIDVKLRKACANARAAPPEARAAHGEEVHQRTKDRDHVVKLYTKVAERCIYPAKKLDYHNMGFGDEEMKVLCEW